MNIAIREPWGLFNRLNRELDGFRVNASNDVAYIPAVDVREEKDAFVLHADLPGVKPEDIEVTAEKGVLTLKGQRKIETSDTATGYQRVERVAGNFTRRFSLPDNVQADAIKAKFTHGVLEVSIPKQPVVPAKRVVVEAA
jgi:HSP20 family protein